MRSREYSAERLNDPWEVIGRSAVPTCLLQFADATASLVLSAPVRRVDWERKEIRRNTLSWLTVKIPSTFRAGGQSPGGWKYNTLPSCWAKMMFLVWTDGNGLE